MAIGIRTPLETTAERARRWGFRWSVSWRTPSHRKLLATRARHASTDGRGPLQPALEGDARLSADLACVHVLSLIFFICHRHGPRVGDFMYRRVLQSFVGTRRRAPAPIAALVTAACAIRSEREDKSHRLVLPRPLGAQSLRASLGHGGAPLTKRPTEADIGGKTQKNPGGRKSTGNIDEILTTTATTTTTTTTVTRPRTLAPRESRGLSPSNPGEPPTSQEGGRQQLSKFKF